MLDAYRPLSLFVALWPTQEFEFPDETPEFAKRLREQFTQFNEHRVVQASGGTPLPSEMPRLGLMGERRQLVFELAPGKVMLRRMCGQAREATMTLAALFESHLSMLTGIQAWLAENHNFRVYRIGVLTHLFCHTRASANEKIARYFLQPRVLHGETPHELQLSMLSRPTLADSGMVNRWLRVRPLRSADARRVDFAAQIELDYNTLPEDTRERTTRDVARFMEAVQANIEEDVPLLDDPDFLA